MIGRRLAQSLAKQNWTAISIEFVLLVAGVFLAHRRQTGTRSARHAARLPFSRSGCTEDLRYELRGEQLLIEYYSAARLVPALQLRQADLTTAVTDLTQHREGNQLGNL